MTCRSCHEARSAVKSAARAVAHGDMRGVAASAKEAGAHIADKAKHEAARIRALVTRKK